MSGPGQRNEFAKKAKKGKLPLQTDNKDYGKKSKAVAVTYDVSAQGDGHKFYGTRTIMTREDKMTLTKFLLAEANDIDEITTLPEKVIKELRTLIRKGAQDLEQNWKDALELTNKAYEVSNVRKPAPDQKGAWKQYMDLLTFSVQQLRATRGADGKWRMTDPMYTESVILSELYNSTNQKAKTDTPPEERPIGARRFFVRIPDTAAQEVDGESMDDIIEKITNKINRSSEVIGTKVRVEHRTPEGAILGVYVNGALREKIKIQDIS